MKFRFSGWQNTAFIVAFMSLFIGSVSTTVAQSNTASHVVSITVLPSHSFELTSQSEVLFGVDDLAATDDAVRQESTFTLSTDNSGKRISVELSNELSDGFRMRAGVSTDVGSVELSELSASSVLLWDGTTEGASMDVNLTIEAEADGAWLYIA